MYDMKNINELKNENIGSTPQSEIPIFSQFYPYFIGKIGIFRGNYDYFKNNLISIENYGISL